MFFWDLNTQRGGVGPERLCFLEARISALMVKCVLKTGEVNQPLFKRQTTPWPSPRPIPFSTLPYFDSFVEPLLYFRRSSLSTCSCLHRGHFPLPPLPPHPSLINTRGLANSSRFAPTSTKRASKACFLLAMLGVSTLKGILSNAECISRSCASKAARASLRSSSVRRRIPGGIPECRPFMAARLRSSAASQACLRARR